MTAGGGPSRLTERGIDREEGSLPFPSSADPVRGWLNAAMTLSRLPEGEREQLREELEAHLRERIRDLMLAGASEAQATRTAIDELGEAAGFAARYARAAGQPRRRQIMQLTIVAAAGALLAGGAMTLMQAGGTVTPSAVFEPVPQPESLPDAHRITVSGDATWSAFFQQIGENAGVPVFVNWHAIHEEMGEDKIGPEMPIGLALENFRPAEAIKLLNERLNGYAAIDMRLTKDRLTFATRHYFDRRELVLTTYDLGVLTDGLLNLKDRELLEDTHEQVIDVVTSFVETPIWTLFGGDLGQIYAFNNKLFVQCPARLQPKVEWVLKELQATMEPAAGGVAPPTVDAVTIETAEGRTARYALWKPDMSLNSFFGNIGWSIAEAKRVRVWRRQGESEVIAFVTGGDAIPAAAARFVLRPGDRIQVE